MGEERDKTPNEIRVGLISKPLFHAVNFVPALRSGIAQCSLAGQHRSISCQSFQSSVQPRGLRVESREWCWRSSSEQAPLACAHLFDLPLSSNTRSFTACPGLPDEEVTLQRKEPAHAV